MEGIYNYLKGNNQISDSEPTLEQWKVAGILHDVDYSREFKDVHPNKTKEALDKFGLEVDDTVMKIIKAHAPKLTGYNCSNKAEWAIYCADSLTGLITAVALILPSKKLADVKLSSVTKRFLKEPKFAAGTRRDEVSECSNPTGLNIPLEKFIEICVEAMKGIGGEIGL